MHVLTTLLATTVGLLYLSGIANASVIRRTPGEVQGWCCSNDCGVCHPGDVHCHDGDHMTCADLTFSEIITDKCCFLESKVMASGVEKYYTTGTGEEVTFLDPVEVATVETVTRSVEETQGWCCTRGCDVCKSDGHHCKKNGECHEIPAFHTPQTDTCCQLQHETEQNGMQKFTNLAGKGVLFISSGGDRSAVSLAECLADTPAEVAAETAVTKGRCCTSDCSTCYGAEIQCIAGTECHDVATVDGPDAHTCCKLIAKRDASGLEKLYTPITGKEVQLLAPTTTGGVVSKRTLPDAPAVAPSGRPDDDPYEGWCCLSSTCSTCLSPPSCVSPSQTCDLYGPFTTCCMLQTRNGGGGRKYYTPIAKQEVEFFDSVEEYLAQALPLSVSTRAAPKYPVESPTKTLAARQCQGVIGGGGGDQGGLPTGSCCTGGCGLCLENCSPPDYACDGSTPLFNTCCMTELRRDVNGVEKRYNPVTGAEMKYVTRGEALSGHGDQGGIGDGGD